MGELSELEKQVHKQRCEYDQARSQLEGSSKCDAILQELKFKEHELGLIEERISKSEHFTAEQAMQQMQEQIQEMEEAIQAMPEEKKQLEKAVKQFEKDIKSLDSGRGERIKHLEKQVEQLKTAAKQQVDKIEKQREKTEQAQVELEVMKNETGAS